MRNHKPYVKFFDRIGRLTNDIYVAIRIEDKNKECFHSQKNTLFITDGVIQPSKEIKDIEISDYTYVIERRTFTGQDGLEYTHHSLTINYDVDLEVLKEKIVEISEISNAS